MKKEHILILRKHFKNHSKVKILLEIIYFLFLTTLASLTPFALLFAIVNGNENKYPNIFLLINIFTYGILYEYFNVTGVDLLLQTWLYTFLAILPIGLRNALLTIIDDYYRDITPDKERELTIDSILY